MIALATRPSEPSALVSVWMAMRANWRSRHIRDIPTTYTKVQAIAARGLAVLVTALALSACDRPGGTTVVEPSVHDRVISSGTIRASYAIYPPYTIKDANTGRLSGIFVETLNEVGERLDLDIQWTEEVGWGAIFEGLNSDRHDIFGAGVWRNSTRGKVGDFSAPLFYNVIKVYGRTGKSRFAAVSDLNDSDTRISTLDGAIEDIIAQSDFPLAQRISVSQLNPWTDVLLNIMTNKADVTFAEPAAVNLFLDKNPGTLTDLFPDYPIRVFGNTYAFKLGEPEFKAMLDAAIEEIRNDGTLESIVTRHERVPGEYLRAIRPYRLDQIDG